MRFLKFILCLFLGALAAGAQQYDYSYGYNDTTCVVIVYSGNSQIAEAIFDHSGNLLKLKSWSPQSLPFFKQYYDGTPQFYECAFEEEHHRGNYESGWNYLWKWVKTSPLHKNYKIDTVITSIGRYIDNGKYSLATSAIDTSLKYFADDALNRALLWYLKGEMYMAQKNKPMARQCLNKCTTIYRNFFNEFDKGPLYYYVHGK